MYGVYYKVVDSHDTRQLIDQPCKFYIIMIHTNNINRVKYYTLHSLLSCFSIVNFSPSFGFSSM